MNQTKDVRTGDMWCTKTPPYYYRFVLDPATGTTMSISDTGEVSIYVSRLFSSSTCQFDGVYTTIWQFIGRVSP